MHLSLGQGGLRLGVKFDDGGAREEGQAIRGVMVVECDPIDGTEWTEDAEESPGSDMWGQELDQTNPCGWFGVGSRIGGMGQSQIAVVLGEIAVVEGGIGLFGIFQFLKFDCSFEWDCLIVGALYVESGPETFVEDGDDILIGDVRGEMGGEWGGESKKII